MSGAGDDTNGVHSRSRAVQLRLDVAGGVGGVDAGRIA